MAVGASATVYSIHENSREFKSVSIRQRNYQVFWMEFLVILDLPQRQCPGTIVPLASQEPQYTGTVKTPEVKSRADALAVILIVAALLIKAGRRQSALPQYPQGVPTVKEE